MLDNAIIGGWRLESFDTRDDSGPPGHLRHPLGLRPSGLILYTTDGWMSAQLAPDPNDDAVELDTFISYGGRYRVDEAARTVVHEVQISTMPELLTQPQLRHFLVDGEVLELSASQFGAHSTLRWRRSSRSED